MSTSPHVLVVGAGSIGASVALHLLRAGARVTVIDAAAPGGVATRNSWAWINATAGNPRRYFDLRVRSMHEWHALERSVPGLRVSWSGGLFWELSGERLRRYAEEHASWGYDIRLVDRAEAAAIEPGLADPPELAAYVPSEGAVEPLEAAQALLAASVALGAELRTHTLARALEIAGGRVRGVVTDAGLLAADETVIAAGIGAVPLLAAAGIALPVRNRPSLLTVSQPHPKLMNGLVITPVAEIRQTAEGRVLASTGFEDRRDEEAPEAAAAMQAAVQAMFTGGGTLTWERHVVGYRPIPEDWVSLLGRVGGLAGLYVTVTHSGITLAPAIGRFAAEEIVTGRRDPLITPFGLERFGLAVG